MGAKNKTSSAGIIAIPIAIVLAATFLSAGTSVALVMSEKNKYTREYAVQGEGGSSFLSFPQGIDETKAAECLNGWLTKKRSDSPLNGKGAAFVQAGKKHDINPSFLLAIAGQESTFGTNYNANARGRANFNYQNMKCAAGQRFSPETQCDGEWAKFASWEASIEAHAKYMQLNYIAQGKNTVEAIQRIYCPEAGCETWTKGINNFMSQISGQCPEFSVGMIAGNGDIIIDPGHGNEDRGFVGPKTEGGNNFDVARRVVNILKGKGLSASLTRASTTDAAGPSLSDRVRFANEHNARLFVSIHSNASGGTYTMGLVYCPLASDGKVNFAPVSCASKTPNGQASTKLAQNIIDNISSTFGFPPRIDGADPGVLNGLRMPAALIEMFFHDHAASVEKVKGREEEMAQAIANGIISSLK